MEWTLFNTLLGVSILAALGAIIWAIVHPSKKSTDVDASDVALLATDMGSPVLDLATEGAGDDGGGVDIDLDLPLQTMMLQLGKPKKFGLISKHLYLYRSLALQLKRYGRM